MEQHTSHEGTTSRLVLKDHAKYEILEFFE